jgi:hypothetical protein
MFSAPILAYMGLHYALSRNPLPTVFYVKGWKKAFSGTYPLYYDAYIGGSHLLSAILCSVAIAAVLLLAAYVAWRALVRKRISPTGATLVESGTHLALLVGVALYLGYHVLGGYQHMNFTFRYWLPGMIVGFVLCLDLLARCRKQSDPNFASTVLEAIEGSAARRWIAAAIIVQAALLSPYVKYVDITPTYARLRDQFAVASYAAYISSWMDAGNYLREKVGPRDRVFLFAGMASGGFTKAYLVDQFYFAPHHSKFKDLASCRPQPPDHQNCMIYYDYILANDPATYPRSHHIEKQYPTIVVLKRNEVSELPAPVLSLASSSKDAFQLRWNDRSMEYFFDIELSENGSAFKQVARLPAGYTSFLVRRADIPNTRIEARVRAVGPQGNSAPSNTLVLQ